MEKSAFEMLSFALKLDLGSYVVSTAKTASKIIGALIRSMKFVSPEVVHYLYKSTIHPCMEYCCQVLPGALKGYFNILDRVQKQVWKVSRLTLSDLIESLVHRCDVTSLNYIIGIILENAALNLLS